MNTTTLKTRTSQGWMHKTGGMIPGLLLAGAIAAVATWAAQFPAIKNNGLSALTLAIIIGLLIGNTVYPPSPASAPAASPSPRPACCAPASCSTVCA
jgi:uncharacterized RDD family membrane protein YckC